MRPSLTWVVDEGDGEAVADVLSRLRRDGIAALDGARVFLNGRPTEGREPIERGDRIDVYPRRQPSRTGELVVLAQRDGVVMVDKPAGLATETTRQGQDSVVTKLIEQLNGGRPHAATRLDVQVSGVVLCCLGRDASRRVRAWRDGAQLVRSYWAIAASHEIPDSGTWEVPLGRTQDRAGRVRVRPWTADGKPAVTRFRVFARIGGASLLELAPRTGRMHQLRAHCAHAGAPLLGDRLYGGPASVVAADGRVLALDRIALHCARIELPALSALAPLPDDLAALWRHLGGRNADWPAAESV
jgi:23S rRNA-/tRNA-specific pseudouridylate synthase